ncbi:NAD(P)-binding protein [Backusella circina FSU 941]|nr:NAD(P)-binding protein [Backusella circina FSU 941]
MQRTALVMGSTGAVGKQLLKEILKNNDYQKVISIGRRTVEIDKEIPQDRLVQKIVDYDDIEKSRQDLKNVDVVYCCLGTTNADAGSKERYRQIDQGYVLNTAKVIAEENKIEGSELAPVHFLYCSALGANKNSFFFYPKTKGQTEEGLANTGFERVSFVRPAFMEPVEPRNPSRFVERVAFSIYAPINNLLGLDGVIKVDMVAKAMRRAALDSAYKPSTASNITKSPIGTSVFGYNNSELFQ